MDKNVFEKIAVEFDAIDDHDVRTTRAFIEKYEQRLRSHGHYKLLALAFYRAGDLHEAYRLLKHVPTDDLDGEDRRKFDLVRHEWKTRNRRRLGLYVPSGKRLSSRLTDGIKNLIRHGRLHDPASVRARIPSFLRGVSEQIRVARSNDVRQLRALLEEHEEAYWERGHAKFLAFNFYHAGCLSRAAAYARDASFEKKSAYEEMVLGNIEFEWRALLRLRANEPPIDLDEPAETFEARVQPIRALYLAASSHPYVLSGYTSRSRSILEAMDNAEAFALVPLTRPGFPFDRADAKFVLRDQMHSSTFDIMETTNPFYGDFEAYLASVLPPLECYVAAHKIDLIHAVSNYRNGTIGLALARRTGKPFVYEVRGLWEETADSKLAGWRDTERFEYERLFEQFLYRNSDGVLAINAQVREVLEGSAEHPNVEILPNCVPRNRVVERSERSKRTELRIGYVGSILEYEGLDDLCRAVGRLRQEGMDVRLDIYGHGADEGRLRTLAANVNKRHIAFHGQIEPERVPEAYERFDVCVFARKPYRVCQLVTPLKPLEAMANDVNVIVSNVVPMMAFSEEGGALSYDAGNLDALVQVLTQFYQMSSEERSERRKRSRTLLLDKFVWEKQQEAMASIYRKSLGKRAKA